MQILHTNRLQLRPIGMHDAEFMLKLINCPGFLQYIGDRHVRTIAQSLTYIENMLANPDVTYWVIRIKESETPVGVVTWVKRDFLPAPDLGYALLPKFEGNGYAFEASQAWLSYQKQPDTDVLAICQADNLASIKLLNKLQFNLDELFEKDGHAMHRYIFH
jgi:RimJ/RimL family protein N-acetyltransferase